MTVMKRRLQPILDAGAVEGEPDYWYGVVEGHAGALWGQLLPFQPSPAPGQRYGPEIVAIVVQEIEGEDGELVLPTVAHGTQ
jgi:hypothetical protein